MIKQNFIKLGATIFIVLVVILEITSLDKLTPDTVLELYIDSLKKGDTDTINSLLSQQFIERINNGKGYSQVMPQKIEDVKIVKFSSQNLGGYEEYELSFYLIQSTDPPMFYNEGEMVFFAKLVRENNTCKIDAMATSPSGIMRNATNSMVL